MKKIPRITILGSGISGLTTAYFSAKQLGNAQITVFDASSIPGGALQTKKEGQFIFEQGPRSLRKSDSIYEILKICEDVNIIKDIVPSKNFDKLYIYYDNKLRLIPKSKNPLQFIKFFFDHPKFIRNFFDYKIVKKKQENNRHIDLNLDEYLKNKFTFNGIRMQGLYKFFNDYILNCVIKGIYFAEPSQLSKDICFKKIQKKKYIYKYVNVDEFKNPKFSESLQTYYQNNLKDASSFNFKDGLQTLPIALHNKLEKDMKIKFNLNSTVTNLDFQDQQIEIKYKSQNGQEQLHQTDYLISTLKPYSLANILGQSKEKQEIIAEFKNELNSIEHLTMTSVNLAYSENVIPKQNETFGILIPTIENNPIVGIILDSCNFPTDQSQNPTRISVFFGKQTPKNISEQELIELAKTQLKNILGIVQNPISYKVKSWNNFFPIYGINHYDKVKKLFSLSEKLNKNFYLHGSYLFAGAIPDLTLLSKCIAKQIK